MTTLHYFFFVIIISLSLVHSSTETTVWGELHREVTLPCYFPPDDEEYIHWTCKDKDNTVIVHSYYDGKDQLDDQGSSYSGRTSLFINEVKNGNASLQIRNLTKNDAVNYYCYVGTKNKGSTQKSVSLQVADFNHSITYKWINQELHLKCIVQNTYLDDTVSIRWYTNNTQVQEQNNAEGNIIVNSSSKSHQCIINHSAVTTTWTGTWEMKGSIEKEEDSLTCECSFCNKSIYLNSSEQVIVTVTDGNLETYVRKDYRNRVLVVGNSLNLSKLSSDDNGKYTCVKKTADRMHIEMTFVNIQITDKSQRRHHFTLISSVIASIFICATIIRICGH